jgi:arylsulfatase A-like enzyme
VLLVILCARPAVQLLTWLARLVDRKLPRLRLFTPEKIFAGVGLVTVALLAVIVRYAILPHLGPIDFTLFVAPLIALVVAIGYHPLPHRWITGVTAGACVAIAVGVAIYARIAEPSLTLEIWGDEPVAGMAIDHLFDLDAIRANVSLAEFRPALKPGAPHPDIVLITIDTVRADHTPPYGGSATMPVLRQLAERGVVFDWAFSPSNVTRRSIPSMITGLGANRVHGRVVGWDLRIDPRHVVLAERLRAGGYETAGFMCCEGFWGSEMHTGLQHGLEHLEIEHDGAGLAKRARAWLEARQHRAGNRPLFLWIHILEPHNWTAITGDPRSDDERTRFYDRVLGMCDAMLADLVAPFRDATKRPIFVVTADHGEALGEHGHAFHSTDLYDSQIHVPLVVSGPGVAAQHVTETVSSTDLVPTLIDLAGFEPPGGRAIDGQSFAPLATGARASAPNGRAFAAMIKDRSNPGGVTAIVEGTWKLVDDGKHLELYDIAVDPNEKTNLATKNPTELAHLRELLLDRQRAAAVSPFE